VGHCTLFSAKEFLHVCHQGYKQVAYAEPTKLSPWELKAGGGDAGMTVAAGASDARSGGFKSFL
jgi:hypothetical protein